MKVFEKDAAIEWDASSRHQSLLGAEVLYFGQETQGIGGDFVETWH